MPFFQNMHFFSFFLHPVATERFSENLIFTFCRWCGLNWVPLKGCVEGPQILLFLENFIHTLTHFDQAYFLPSPSPSLLFPSSIPPSRFPPNFMSLPSLLPNFIPSLPLLLSHSPCRCCQDVHGQRAAYQPSSLSRAYVEGLVSSTCAVPYWK